MGLFGTIGGNIKFNSKVLMICLLMPIHNYGQEILGNLIDDDGDCNVDCDDLEFGVRSFQYTDGMSANFVKGQDNFTANTAGTSLTNLYIPYDIALDPTTDKVFLSELGNSRILRFSSYDDFLFGLGPEAVLGQTNFTSNATGVTSSNLSSPTGIFVDNSGILWVCDWGNNRVLRFDNASSIGTGASADGVLGQANFFGSGNGVSIATMSRPVDVVVDMGTLWVADQSNGRILRYDDVSTKSNGADADGVLGAANFTSVSSVVNQSNLVIAGGLAIICNSLYASDEGANRILRWDNPSLLSNGSNANVVLGQSSFTSSNANTSRDGLSTPRILSTDKYHNLYVSDSDNHRVLVFREAGAKPNGANADRVLGQANFTSGLSGLDANSFNTPRGVAILDDGVNQALAVADVFNNRVMIYTPANHTTNEETTINSILPGYDSGVPGGRNYTITSQPEIGDVVINNTSTGEFSYTPGGICAVNEDTQIKINYSVSNVNGCSVLGQLKIIVTESAPCVEDCFNGIDDDINGFIDGHDPICDHDNDNISNAVDADLDNDGILNTIENNVFSTICPNVVYRILYQETFGDGIRTSSQNSQLCYEDGNSSSCSPVYNAGTYTASTEPGEYTVVNESNKANIGKYGWLNFGDYNAIGQSRMMVCNPSQIGEVIYAFRVDGIVSGIPSYFSTKFKNLYPSGTGETPAQVRINFMDTNRVVIHSRTQTILENETWYNVFENRLFGLETSLLIEYVNENPAASGNDFVMDDLVFKQILRDCDGDSVANIYDLDSDNDGITDIAEQGNLDVDYNGMTDNINGGNSLSIDSNNNGADDNYESDPMLDSDLDLIWDILDLDSDNDGLYDISEAGGTDSNNDGILGVASIGFENGNGLSAIVDPSDGGVGLVNNDSDIDGIMDAKELDSDNDGCNDVIEAGFPDDDRNGYLGNGTIGSGLIVNNRGIVTP